MKKWTQRDLKFCKNDRPKRYNNEKWVNKIENHGENWYKLLQKCQMIDFCEKRPTLGQINSGTKCDRDK